MSTIDTLREALGERADSVTLPPDAVDTAVQHGYAVRRRRRVVVGFGSAALVAVVAVPIATGWSPTPDNGPAVPSPSVSQDGPPPVTTPSTTPAALPNLPLGARAAVPYAIGNVVIDGDVRIEVEGAVWSFVKVGDQYAVISQTPDSDITRLDLVARDGTIRELDRGLILGVVAGGEDSRIALAWGWQPSLQGGPGTLKALYELDQSPITHDLAPDSLAAAVRAVGPGGVIVSYQGDPEGPPALWDVEASTVEPLIDDVAEGGRSFVGLVDDGRLAVISDAFGDGCLTAYDLLDGDRQVWERCGYVSGWLSPTGSLMFNEFAVYDAATGTLEQQFDVLFEYMVGVKWEDDDHVLLAGDPDMEELADGPLVRCTVSTGACERVPMDDELEPGMRIVFG